jgi:hypothetical protein
VACLHITQGDGLFRKSREDLKIGRDGESKEEKVLMLSNVNKAVAVALCVSNDNAFSPILCGPRFIEERFISS